MRNQANHADDSQLHLLLFGDETSNAYRSALAHVETCEMCRERLDDLSGDEAFDAEARGLLRGYLDPGDPFEASANPLSAVDLDRLDPPRHPEMLGRLGRYDIERVIGHGGMGVVLKGFDTELNRPVALKLLAKHLAHSGAARQRFAREARAAAAVVHEHVLAIHTVETGDSTEDPADERAPFLVMPYVAGESLQSRVDREGPLDAKEILRIGAQAAAGLQAAHDQGVVHRDIKPSNILLEGGVERTLVADFGLAQTVDDATLTRTGVITGTPNYMAPEQATGRPTDARSDLFSLGCVLYFLATGKPPFRAERAMGVLHRVCHEPHTPVWQTRPETPDGLCDLIDRLLEKAPSRRPASAGEVRDALQQILANLQHPAPRHWVTLKRFGRRHRKALRVMSGVIFVLGLARAAMLLTPPSAAPPMTTPRLQDGSSPRFSLDTWQQASLQEAAQWATDIGQLSQRLRGLESSGAPLTAPADPWNHDIRDLHWQIEQRRSAGF